MRHYSSAVRLALAVVSILGLTGPVHAGEQVPFKGSVEGRHVSRTPLDPPFVFDVFELMGQATQLGRFELVIEVVVDFGTRPVTGEGTLIVHRSQR